MSKEGRTFQDRDVQRSHIVLLVLPCPAFQQKSKVSYILPQIVLCFGICVLLFKKHSLSCFDYFWGSVSYYSRNITIFLSLSVTRLNTRT